MPEFANTRSLRVAVGLGTIPRVVGDAQPIYKKPIPIADGLHRIESLYRPYHAELKALIERARGWFGVAVLIDCHSMPSNAADASGLDIVLGDRFGASAAPAVVDILEASLRGAGYRVRRNKPFAGGFITEHFGAPGEGRSCGSDRDRPGALPRRAQDRQDRKMARPQRRSVRGGEGAGARVRRGFRGEQARRRMTRRIGAGAMASSPGGLEPAARRGPSPALQHATNAAHKSLARANAAQPGAQLPDLTVPPTQGKAKKGGRHVATAALSLGRKRPRRAYAAGHAAPQQYRR